MAQSIRGTLARMPTRRDKIGEANQRQCDRSSADMAYLTLAIACELLHVSRDTIERLIRNGAIAAIDVSPRADRPGHRPMWRIRAAALEEFLTSRERGAMSAKRPAPARPRPSNHMDTLEFI